MKNHKLDACRCCQKTGAPLIILALIVLVILLVPSPGRAGVILDAEVRLTYEDNVIGILSDQNAEWPDKATG